MPKTPQPKAKYVDGFVLMIPKKNLPTYRRMARMAEKMWRKHGALDYKECVGDDLKVKMGLPFPKLVKSKPSEIIVFAYITYKSRAHRDRVNAKVMKEMDEQMAKYKDMPMPFDMNRMAYGGFSVIVGA